MITQYVPSGAKTTLTDQEVGEALSGTTHITIRVPSKNGVGYDLVRVSSVMVSGTSAFVQLDL